MPATAVISDHDRPPRRRSPRIALLIPLEVSGKDVAKSCFNVVTTATNLNRYGATVHLNRDLAVESVIVLTNNRGSRTSARIVDQTLARDIYAYGVEFLEAENTQNFWGIRFPACPQEHGPS